MPGGGEKAAEWRLEQEGQQAPGAVTCSRPGHASTGQGGRLQERRPPLQVQEVQGLVASVRSSPSCRVAPCHLQVPQEGQH